MNSPRVWATFAILGMGILSSSAGEGATIVFDQAPAANDGTISFDGTAAGVLVGTNIVFTNISGDGTDNDAFPIDCAGCLLNFTTGSIISVVGNIYTFAGGGTFTITGGSLLAGIPGGTTLLSGTWDNPVVVEVTPTTLDMLEKGTDTKHEDLLDYFFVDPPSDWIFTDVAIQIESEAGGVVKFAGPTYTGFSADLDFGGNADLVNSSAVPEPASALLLLLGLGSLAAYRRRTN